MYKKLIECLRDQVETAAQMVDKDYLAAQNDESLAVVVDRLWDAYDNLHEAAERTPE